MKYLFFVQSDGRGHLTQALSLAEELRQKGHEIVAVILNDNPTRVIPDFFKDGIKAPLYFIKSPYFLINKDGTGINLHKSIFFNVFRLKTYLKSLKTIDNLCHKYQPDVVINFFEPLAGLYNIFYQFKIPFFSVGHQFFVEHPAFKKPAGHFKDYRYFVFYNHLTSYGSTAIMALSFTAEPDCPEKKIVVCPPLIRFDVKNLTPKCDNFILSYILNYGCCEEIKNWAILHPEQKVEAFWDKKDESETKSFGSNLVFYPISGQRFLDLLQNCSTYITTGGFDSISEAAYLQKNILMVPTKNHYEQLCNAYDATRAKLAVFDSFFNIDLAISEQKTRSAEPERIFKNWVDNNSKKIVDFVTLEKSIK